MSPSDLNENYVLLIPRPEHFAQIQDLCKRVYPFSKPWNVDQLESHRSYFPDGQLIVLEKSSGRVVGMAFSLIISWDDYLTQDSWKDFTASGYFHNHDPRKGKTLYGAEVMVDPEMRGRGIGKMLYQGRMAIVEKYGLKRIRAGARLRGYGKYEDQFSPQEYVKRVTEKKIYDPTLSFQISQGFKVIDVAPNYLFNDPESLGYAAVIEWLNPKLATAKDSERQKQSAESLFSGNKFVSEHLPRELRRLVRKATLVLGEVIKEYEGDALFERIEFYREHLKKTRTTRDKPHLSFLLKQVRGENSQRRMKLAHAFAIQLELVNVCEAAYRTWRQRLKPTPQSVKTKLNLTYVLTAHPTEARSKETVEVLSSLGHLLVEALQNGFLYNENELMSQMRMLWLQPFSKTNRPKVIDEAEHIYSLIFSPELFDFILTDKPSYDIKLRTWVGGDKDGHPGVNRTVMRECFNLSRKYILSAIRKKLELVTSQVNRLEQTGSVRKSDLKGLQDLAAGLEVIRTIGPGDGARVKAWTIKYRRFLRSSDKFVKLHSQIHLINRIIEIFPGLVFPIELREDSGLIKLAIKDKASAIRGMLTELREISGALGVTAYARGLVASNCESTDDISHACQLVQLASGSKTLPVIPLFETRAALASGKKIVKSWLGEKRNHELVVRQWSGTFEVMLGYSDSAKEIGVLPSRFLISRAMTDLEKVIKSFGIQGHFFHGSGGSVARGGGSLKEQIAWWPNMAIAHPKVTIQGEMIQRKFASKEILNSQCIHFATEALRRKTRTIKATNSPQLERFVARVSQTYSDLVNDEKLLGRLLDATPYHYLDVLKIGSRPSKRPEKRVSVKSLRAIPWVLCWTQTRLLLPTWWGIGTAWRELDDVGRAELRTQMETDPLLSSFVKALGFTLAKVELDVWQLYFAGKGDEELFGLVAREFDEAVHFVQAMSQSKELLWYRPWLKESIQLRAPNIHILNMLQILSIESDDESLLKETIVGIACGMLTTG